MAETASTRGKETNERPIEKRWESDEEFKLKITREPAKKG